MQTYHHLARIIWSKSALSIRSSSRLIGDHALKFQDETELATSAYLYYGRDQYSGHVFGGNRVDHRAIDFTVEPLWKNMESDQFVRDATHLAKYIVDYRAELSEKRLPVLPDFKQIEPGYLRSLLPNKAPEDGEDFEAVFGDFRDKVIPGVTHWQHPNFHAYFPTGSTYPSLLGDLLSSALAPVGVTWMACPACTELEVITLDWLVQALGLPEKFLSTCSKSDCLHHGGGAIESSASLACATLMMGLRENALAKLFGGGVTKTEDGLRGCGAATNVDRLVAYTSDQAHSSVTRAFRISMMRYREIPTKPVGRKRVFNAEELRSAMARDKSAGLIPLVCVATAGTTSTCEFDDVEAIGRVCKEFNVWFHLDAAYAGSALLCPEYRTLVNGLEFVNSVCINPDKMMMVNLDCTILWVDNQEVLTKAFAEEPTYLKDNFRGMPEYWRWSISLSRRFRALKLWFVIRMYGLKGLRKYIRHHAKMAQVFETLISDDDRFEVTNDVRFGLVCFRLKGENCQTESLYNQLLTDGRIFMSPGSVTNTLDAEKSIYFLRFVASPLTTVEDVKFAYRVLTETVERSEYTSLNIVKTEGRNIL